MYASSSSLSSSSSSPSTASSPPVLRSSSSSSSSSSSASSSSSSSSSSSYDDDGPSLSLLSGLVGEDLETLVAFIECVLDKRFNPVSNVWEVWVYWGAPVRQYTWEPYDKLVGPGFAVLQEYEAACRSSRSSSTRFTLQSVTRRRQRANLPPQERAAVREQDRQSHAARWESMPIEGKEAIRLQNAQSHAARRESMPIEGKEAIRLQNAQSHAARRVSMPIEAKEAIREQDRQARSGRRSARRSFSDTEIECIDALAALRACGTVHLNISEAPESLHRLLRALAVIVGASGDMLPLGLFVPSNATKERLTRKAQRQLHSPWLTCCACAAQIKGLHPTAKTQVLAALNLDKLALLRNVDSLAELVPRHRDDFNIIPKLDALLQLQSARTRGVRACGF